MTKIPGNAVDPAAADITGPTEEMLRALQMMGTEAEAKAAGSLGAVLSGPPQSVAVIEAGATALAKWWAAGLGAAATVAWGSVVKFWTGQDTGTHRMILLVAGIASAAAILAIALILYADLSSRGAAAVATVEGRARVAVSMMELARASYTPPSDSETVQVLPVSPRMLVEHVAKPKAEESGWMAIAMSISKDKSVSYYLVKGADGEWVGADGVAFA